jgi:hypothetical protein
MKKLDIAITKAQLVSFDVTAEEGKPEVSVTLALMTEGGKQITSYSVRTNSWSDKDKIDLPIEALPHIGALARILEGVAVRHCRDSQLALAAPKAAAVPKKAVLKNFSPELDGTEVNIVDVSDEPINLDDIPF